MVVASDKAKKRSACCVRKSTLHHQMLFSSTTTRRRQKQWQQCFLLILFGVFLQITMHRLTAILDQEGGASRIPDDNQIVLSQNDNGSPKSHVDINTAKVMEEKQVRQDFPLEVRANTIEVENLTTIAASSPTLSPTFHPSSPPTLAPSFPPSSTIQKDEEAQDSTINTSSIKRVVRKSGDQLEQIVYETTKLLYKDSPDLEKWLAAPLPKIFIYDTLSKDWSDVPTISQCVNHNFLGPERGDKVGNSTNSTTLDPTNNCLWEPRICDNIKNPIGSKDRIKKFLNYKSNYNNDVAYLQWFRGYSHLTTNASEADIFLVPYPHQSHCLCLRDIVKHPNKCSYNLELIQPHVLDKLAYFNDEKFDDRHLFLYGMDYGFLRKEYRRAIRNSMSISLGPKGRCKQLAPGAPCGHFVTPYLSTETAFQPPAIAESILSSSREGGEAKQRVFSVGAVFGTPDYLVQRVAMMKNRSIYFGNSVGGLPFKLIDLGMGRSQIIARDIIAVYQKSMFCPILPGDSCPQKRFFDVILSGCIPVVPRFSPSDEEGYPTFFSWMNRCSIRRTYPFSKGSFFGDATVGIDYESIVVMFDGICGLPCMKPAIEKVMGNTTELNRIRGNMQQYAKLFTFGLDENMYKSMDGFSAMLVALRHHVFNLKGIISSNSTALTVSEVTNTTSGK